VQANLPQYQRQLHSTGCRQITLHVVSCFLLLLLCVLSRPAAVLPAEIELYNVAGDRIDPALLTAESSSIYVENGNPYKASNCIDGNSIGVYVNAASGGYWGSLCCTNPATGSPEPWLAFTYPCSESLAKVVLQSWRVTPTT
jgi:hypothetical protein